MNKRWTIKPYSEKEVRALQQSLRIHPLLCQLLVMRGITTYDAAKAFFRPALDQLYDPWLMKDMKVAVQRIEEAIRQEEKIMVYGDYDVDGTTAVAMVYDFLRQLYPHVTYYVPHRYREGYGISYAGIDHARSEGISLIIALDCGIKSVAHIDYARQWGIDFIVCDHHLPDPLLPKAAAILNPKQSDCPYPYKELSGCGIGFKLITALAEKKGLPPEKVFSYLDLVATSIAADIVPITGENRILVYYGLKKVNEDPCPGIKALITLSGLKSPLSTSNLVFVIAPRVNAAGRMDDARKAVQLFLEKNDIHALEYAALLHADNDDRKEADSTITEEAASMIEQDRVLRHRKSTVLFQPHWHKGVVGIVAARLVERFYRPTIVLTKSNEMVTGSARSVAGFNVYEAIHQCRDLLSSYGGHFYAAGLTLKQENLEAFQQKFEEVVCQSIPPALLVPEIEIDAVISLAQITPALFNIIRQFEPFGPGNLRPVFMARAVMDAGYSRIVKEDHLRFTVKQADGTLFNGIGFNLAHKFDIVSGGQPFDLCFTIAENEWNGKVTLQLKVIDIRPSA